MKTAMFLALCSTSAFSQGVHPSALFPPRPEIPEAVSFFVPFILPKIIQDVFQLREFIAGEEFSAFRIAHGDITAVDAIFDKAMRLSLNNTYEALFISLVATMEHRRVDVRIPVVKIIIPLPLTSESAEEFQQRVQCLPSRLYADSPRSEHGDKDKLQHFFGSAFATYVSESRESAEAVGNFVEAKESRYVPGEVVDMRDLRANRQGQAFGLALLGGLPAWPSDFLGDTRERVDAISDSIHVEHP